jgi:DNA modification methylase
VIDLRLGDCLDSLPSGVDFVLTDPPYPDYYAEEYQYRDGILDFLKDYPCRQFVFWTSKVDFPLDYTAIHIWDKKTGAGSQYERIFERNGGAAYRVFRHYLINSTVAASFTGDVFTGHPSQKPEKLLSEIIEKFTKVGDVVYDPFMGTGSAGVSAAKLRRGYIGREINPAYFEVAQKRIAEAQQQMVMPL